MQGIHRERGNLGDDIKASDVSIMSSWGDGHKLGNIFIAMGPNNSCVEVKLRQLMNAVLYLQDTACSLRTHLAVAMVALSRAGALTGSARKISRFPAALPARILSFTASVTISFVGLRRFCISSFV